jgi:hypothetical protein
MTLNMNEFFVAVGNVRVKRFLVEIQIWYNSVSGLLSDEASRVLPRSGQMVVIFCHNERLHNSDL